MERAQALRRMEETVLLVIQEIGDDVTRCFIVADKERVGEYTTNIKKKGGGGQFGGESRQSIS